MTVYKEALVRLIQSRKIQVFAGVIVVLLVAGFAISQLITPDNQKIAAAKKTNIRISPTSTVILRSQPTDTPYPFYTSVQTIKPTNTPSPTVVMPTATPIPQPSQQSEPLTVKSFLPSFLWADYMTIGPTEGFIEGTGFDNGTTAELLGPHISAGDTISSNDTSYSLAVIGYNPRYLRVKLPEGLYNSYYAVRVKNSRGEIVSFNGNVLLVSGSTKAQSDAYDQMYTDSLTETPTPSEQ